MDKNRSLRKSLIISFVLLVSIPLISLSFVGIKLFNDSLSREITARNQLLASSIAQQYNEILNQPFDILQAIRSDILANDWLAAERTIHSILKKYPYFESIQILDRTGKISYVFPYDEAYLGLDMRRQAYFQKAMESGQNYWSPNFISWRTGQPVISLSVPFANGQQKGVIAGFFNLKEITNIGEMPLGKGSYVVTLDRNGTYIAHPSIRNVLERRREPFYTQLRSSPGAATQRIDDNGHAMLVSKAIVPQTGWMVLVYQGVVEAFAPVSQAMSSFLLVLLLTVAATLLLPARMFHKINVAIQLLLQKSKEMANGNYDQPIPYDSYQEINGMAVYLNRMSEQISQRENEIRLSEARYKAILNTANDAIILQSLDEDFPLRFIQGNDVFCRMLGYSWPEIKQLYPADISDSDFWQDPDGLIKRLRSEKQILQESVIISQSGQRIPVEIRLHLFEYHDESRILSIIRDISERKQMEATLENERILLAQRVEERTMQLSITNAELARASETKDQFMASMSHELRTPLSAILGISEALQEELNEQINPQQLRYLSIIEESGRHLLTLINDILDLSKIQAGKMDMDWTEVSIADVTQSAVRIIESAASKKGISFTLQNDSVSQQLWADYGLLKQILINLLSNAVKFTPEGGRIGLYINSSLEQGVSFSVWDTGIGIDNEDRDRLFQPFVQLDSRISRKYPGTGLGLSLVASLTELHGGMIQLISEAGQGSCFTVTIPWNENQLQTLES